MRLMLKAITHPNGDLVVYGDAKLLLYRAMQDMQAHVAGKDDAAELQRALAALQAVLGTYDGTLPSAKELLGDPQREMLARNLLKG